MSGTGVVLREGSLTIELDREHDVLLMQCAHHQTQDAVRLSRSEVANRMTDFFNRHDACRHDIATLAIPR